MAAFNVNAGGLLTNTNQSISFLRNPAREGVIGIDGVYTNPAGVAFLEDGFHLSLNWQYAKQTRTAVTANPLFKLGVKNNGSDLKSFEGKAKAPCIPSIQAAYNKGKWSYQFNFAIAGGGGKCEYANGVGSFENVVGQIAYGLGNNEGLKQLKAAGLPIPMIEGYDNDGYMQGRQYYFGFTLGTAYKVNENLAVYGGLRALYGSASYKAKIENLRAMAGGKAYSLTEYFTTVQSVIQGAIEGAVAQGVQAGIPADQVMQSPGVLQLQGAAALLQQSAAPLAQYSEGVNLQSDQTGFGVAPIIGVDYKVGNLNIGAKYEFRTRIAMKNKSTAREMNEQIPIINEYVDGTKVREDQPALFTIGAQWSVLPQVRLSAGYHHFFDEESKKYNDEQKCLKNGTNEYLGGVEVDVHKRVTLSAGVQLTRYGLTDEFMNDMKFVTNSWSLGVGAAVKLSEKATLNVAYFNTFYDHYKTAKNPTTGVSVDFTRTNTVLGAGLDINF